MALWAKTQLLPPEAMNQLRNYYGDNFPLEVRHFLASWLEEKLCSTYGRAEFDYANGAVNGNESFDQYSNTFLMQFVQQLEVTSNSLTSEDHFIAKMKLVDAANTFKQRYAHNPARLLRVLKEGFSLELDLVRQAEEVGSLGTTQPGVGVVAGMGIPSAAAHEILQQLELLKGRTHDTADDLRRMEQEQEGFAIQYHDCTKISAHLNHLASQPNSPTNQDTTRKLIKQKDLYEQMLQSKVAGLISARVQTAEKLKHTLTLVASVQTKILDEELIRWKREQQLAGNGATFNNNLDVIQEWCETLAEIIWLNRQQIKEAERLQQKLPLETQVTDILPTLNNQITQLLSSLVTSTFVIEKQPPQVMKTNTRFTATVRLLVGGKLNVHMTPPHVKVTIISEPQANALLKNEKVAKGDVSGEILNNTGTMEYNTTNRQLQVSFRNMQLKKIKRAEKKGTESVMDEKFSLLFSSQFSVGGGELMFQVWTLSLPVVVIVHGNQEPHAWATVTWDNAFAEPGRVPFIVPEKVAWPALAEALSIKFKSQTGRGLTDSSLRFLADKVFRLPGGASDYNSLVLSWSQFCKEPLPERNFTFWEWFYAVMKLTREHLKGPWFDGHIIGFVRKKQAEEMISTSANGTFLLRFSDSELGGVTIAWIGYSEDSKHPEVFMLLPFTSKDFSIRCLADRINDLGNLAYLYPDTPKHQAFSKYCTPYSEANPAKSNGYVKATLVTHIPGPLGSNPPTPHMYPPQSPDTGSIHSEVQSVGGLGGGGNDEMYDLPDISFDDFGTFSNELYYSQR